MSGDSVASTVDYFGSTATVTCPRPYQQQYFAGLYHDKSLNKGKGSPSILDCRA